MNDDAKPERALKQEVILLGSCLLIAFVLGGIGLIITNFLAGCPFYDFELATEWLQTRFKDGKLAAEEFSIDCTEDRLDVMSSPTDEEYIRAYTPHARRLLAMIRSDPSNTKAVRIMLEFELPSFYRFGGHHEHDAVQQWLGAVPDTVDAAVYGEVKMHMAWRLMRRKLPDLEGALSQIEQIDEAALLSEWLRREAFETRLILLRRLGREDDAKQFVREAEQSILEKLAASTKTRDDATWEETTAVASLYRLGCTNAARQLALDAIAETSPAKIRKFWGQLPLVANIEEMKAIIVACGDPSKADSLRIVLARRMKGTMAPDEALTILGQIGKASPPVVLAEACLMEGGIRRGMTPPDLVGARTALERVDVATLGTNEMAALVKHQLILVLADSGQTNDAQELALTSFGESEFVTPTGRGFLTPAARSMIYVGLTNETMQSYIDAYKAAGVSNPEYRASVAYKGAQRELNYKDRLP